ncbi:MAG: hypothetical protein V4700_05590 [Pseudomonadota bacterium]
MIKKLCTGQKFKKRWVTRMLASFLWRKPAKKSVSSGRTHLTYFLSCAEIKKVRAHWILIIFAYFLINPLAVVADPKMDPLQSYRDEINKAEATAAQNVLDQLGPSSDDSSNPYSNPSPPQSAASSNNESAFSPPSTETQNNARPIHKSQNSNPWLKPNPWEAQSKINPWANAPIPSQTGPTNSSSVNTYPPPISPPNIFALPQTSPNPLPKKN